MSQKKLTAEQIAEKFMPGWHARPEADSAMASPPRADAVVPSITELRKRYFSNSTVSPEYLEPVAADTKIVVMEPPTSAERGMDCVTTTKAVVVSITDGKVIGAQG